MDAVRQQENRALLRQFVEQEADTLLNILRAYVLRMGIATPQTAAAAADELLSEVVIEALQHPARYDPQRRPMAWLLGIAINLIKRRREQQARLEQREPLLRDLYQEAAEQLSDGELFDRFVALAARDPTRRLEENEQLAALLAPLPQDEQRLLRLALLHEMDGRLLGQALGITAGAARVRLHRTLKKLRGLLGPRRMEDEHG